MAQAEAPDLADLVVYGRFLALEVEGQVHQGAGQGVVKALGIEVINYILGRQLHLGDSVLFREGTQIKFAGGGGGPEVVFVAMDDILAIVELALVPDVELPETGEGKPAA